MLGEATVLSLESLMCTVKSWSQFGLRIWIRETIACFVWDNFLLKNLRS